MALDPRLMMVDYSQLGQIGSAVGQGMQANRMKMVEGLAGKALMGDPSAMEQLSQFDPAAAAQVQQKMEEQKYQSSQRDMQNKVALSKEIQGFFTQFGSIEDPDEFIMKANQAVSSSNAFPLMQQQMKESGEFFDYSDYDTARQFFQQAQGQGGKSFADKAVAAQRTNPETGEVEQGFMVYDSATKKGRFETIEGGVLKEKPEEKRQRELESKKEFESYKTTQDFIREMNKQTQTPEGRLKLADAKRKEIQADSAVKANQMRAVDALKTINKLASSDLSKIYGRGESYYPDLLRSQEGIDMIASRDQVVNILKLMGRGELKGQGSVSDIETKLLADASTILSNIDISDTKAAEELERIRPIFERVLTDAGEEVPESLKSPQQKNTTSKYQIEVIE